MKPLAEVEAILIDCGLKASGLDQGALHAVRVSLAPEQRPRGRSSADPQPLPLANAMALAGFVFGMHTRFESPTADEQKWIDDSAAYVRGIIPEIPVLDAPEWIYFELGQWGATGDRTYLSRLIDRAKHRDGSSNAISASGQALGILQLAAFSNPAYVGIYQGLGFDPDAVKYGDNPSGLESFETLRGDREIEPLKTGVLDPDAGKPETQGSTSSLPGAAYATGLKVSDPVTFSGMSAFLGSVEARDGVIVTAVGAISITDALAAIGALTAVTRALLLPLPFDGYQWDDYAGVGAPASILFTVDVFEGERLKLFQPVALQPVYVAGRALFDGGGWLPSLYDGAVNTFMPLQSDRVYDLNAAKCLIATALRKKLATGGSTPAGYNPAPTAADAAAVVVASQSIKTPAEDGANSDSSASNPAPATPAAGSGAVARLQTAAKAEQLKSAAKKKAAKNKRKR